MLAGCGSDAELGGSSGALPPGEGLPTGYRFQSVLEGGSSLPDGRTVAELPRLVQAWQGGVIFVARDDRGARGVYRATYEGDRLGPLRTLLREGEKTLDGTVVSRLDHRGDCNPEGNYAAVVTTSDGTEAVVLARPEGARRLLGLRDAISGVDGGQYGSSFVGVSLHTADDLLVCGQFGTRQPARCRQGLLHLAGARPETARVLLQTGVPGPEMQASLTALGLCNLGRSGQYVVQAFGPGAPGATTTLDAQPTGVLGGQVGSQAIPLAGHPQLGVSGARAATPEFRSGSVLNGPRQLGDATGYVVYSSPTSCELVVGGRSLARSGDRSPRNQRIAAFYPPASGAGGQIFYQALTGTVEQPASRGSELILQRQDQRFSLLALGDRIGGRPLLNFHFGYKAEQATEAGFLALIGEFPNRVPALIVGVPV